MPDDPTRKVLITGLTGLIGGEIAAYLSECGHTVWALIRAQDREHAAGRLMERLARSRRAAASNITPLCGDICKPMWGMAGDDLAGLRSQCDVIVHAAGETSFKDIKSCNDVNVTGVRELVRLARTWEKPVRIFYLSTAAVCCEPAHSALKEDANPTGYVNGYTASKREAEAILQESGLDVVILRPAIVLSRGIDDHRFARSILWAIPAMIIMGYAPVDPDSHVDIVPVDYVAQAVERLICKDKLRYRCYHISGGARAAVTCSEMHSVATQIYPEAGSRVRFCGLDEVQNAVRQNTFAKGLLRAINYYLPFINADVVYSNDRLVQELDGHMPPCPKLTEYLNDLLKQIREEEAVEESQRP